MENIDPHKEYNYSHDQILMTAFNYELRNNLSLNPKYDNVRDVVELYLQERIDEIKNRWK